MAYSCPLHSWFSHFYSCPECTISITDSDLPVAPQNFDHVERYVSNLPIARVKHIREVAELCLGNASAREEYLIGFILELTN